MAASPSLLGLLKAQKLIPLVVVAAGLMAYQNSFTGPFVFDDVPSILENLTIRHLWPIENVLSPPHRGGITVEGRPLLNLSFAVNHAFGGYNVWGYHALNLAIHVLAGLALLGIVRRTLLQPRLRERFGAAANELALAVAVLWTVHPLQTESVTYIVQRAESLMGLFYLLTLYCFIRAIESPRPRVWYVLCVTACGLGMASKEVMVSAPVMVLLYDRTFVSGSFRQAWRRRWSLYSALAVTWLLLGYLVFFTGNFSNALANARLLGYSRWTYLLTESGVLLHYLRLSVWPYPLCFDYYGWPVARTWTGMLLPALVIASLLVATAWALTKNSASGVLGAWFFLILAPTSSFFPTDSPAYEHRMYLPLAAVVVLVVMGIHALVGRRTVAVVAALAVVLGDLTVQRNEDYRSGIAIWGDTVAKRPRDPRAHNNLGIALLQAGEGREAIEQYEQAVQINPNYGEAQFNLGLALQRAGEAGKAVEHDEQAVRLKPDFAEAHLNLGEVLAEVGRPEDAIRQYQEALRLKPDYAEAHLNLGEALARLGRPEDAIRHYLEALRLKPDIAEVHMNFGNALLPLGKVQEAIAQYEEALRIRPDYPQAHDNLGIALTQAGRVPEAMKHWEQALQLKPDDIKACYNLGQALERAGKNAEATAYYQQALILQPDFAPARSALERLRAGQ